MPEELFTTCYQSPLGAMRISGTDSYISKVIFMDDNEVVALHPNAVVNQCVEELMEYFNGRRLTFDIPVYQKGTDFQARVWGELLNIDFGKTISYLQLARRLGDANCIRAAASGNGKNNLAIMVPCHRVIGSDQSLTGYAGGLWRKRWLLDHENKIANGVRTLF